MTRVKICGITSTADAKIAIEAGADALGFLVGQGLPSPRKFIEPEAAASIIATVPPLVSTVMVTTLDDADEIIKNAVTTGVSTIQLHGNIALDGIRRIRENLPHLKLYKVIHVYDGTHKPLLNEIKSLEGEVDAIALDTAQKETGFVGGTGKTHDWTLSRGIVGATSLPVILAGGLNPENVAEAIRTVHPYAVDVNSGVSQADGSKDPEKVMMFVQLAKQG